MDEQSEVFTLKYRECTPEDYLCIYKHRELFHNEVQHDEGDYVKPIGILGMMCPCLRSCNTNVGGLVSLFMGASLTSFTEATYYILYATIKFIRGRIHHRMNKDVEYNHIKKY
uniref:Uncharacterized protein n=1 Tax=Megaselia scalaris TaxID=36166 RepID=T1GS99_MEGSC